ncbi:hypothetical protein EYF80_051308 [Liparis tanakae]|uniref:IRF tryptophan pentad repeat domain-containing protein n=1 Tax=Liparis tanakae TaxID=230148 RepID=A0A4Z2FBJ0_9TELE|nr:hypothetical protein EYF80_051308 [Liparis tanakae]
MRSSGAKHSGRLSESRRPPAAGASIARSFAAARFNWNTDKRTRSEPRIQIALRDSPPFLKRRRRYGANRSGR